MDAAIEKSENKFKGRNANPRLTASQGVRADKHDRPNRRDIKHRADRDGVAHNNVPLKQPDFFPTDNFIFKCSEAGRDAVRDLAALEQNINRRGTAFDGSACGFGEDDKGRTWFSVSNGYDLLEGQAFPVYYQWIHIR